MDLVSSYGTLANGGKAIGHTTILTIKDTEGKDVVDPYVPPAGVQVVSPQAAWIVTDILNGNTVRSINPFWGKFSITGPGRPPAGDAQDRHEQRRQGPQRLRLHRPADVRRPGRRRLRPRRRVPGTATATTPWCRPPRTRSSRSTSRPTSGRASSTRPRPSGRRRTSSARPRASPRSPSTRSPGCWPTRARTRSRSGSSSGPSRRTGSRRTCAASPSSTSPASSAATIVAGGRP